MKNLLLLCTREEIHDHVMSLWQSDAFRDSHASRGFIYEIVEQFAWMPRIFAVMTNETLEWAHFSTWWGVLMGREGYANPVISDLYWLHEFFHAARMPYIPGIGKAAFDDKMQRNELESSVLSEVQVYFEMPGLREQTFNHPIYADRFLDDPAIQNLWRVNKTVAIETIRSIRRDVMVSKPEHLMDISEKWTRRFTEQNAVWSVTWGNRYLEVEQKMYDIQVLATADRAVALEMHRAWIEGEAAADPEDHIPFRQEATWFAPFYWGNKEQYKKAMEAE